MIIIFFHGNACISKLWHNKLTTKYKVLSQIASKHCYYVYIYVWSLQIYSIIFISDVSLMINTINLDQPKHAALTYPDRQFQLPLDFLFQESLLYTSIPLRRDVSAQISLHGLRSLICVDSLRRVHTVGFLVEWLIYILKWARQCE